MHKLVLDTNILVSYCISQLGYSFRIIDGLILKDYAEWIITEDIMKEYEVVLSRTRFSKKFPRFEMLSQQLLYFIRKRATMVYPAIKLDVLSDSTDNKFLEAVLASGADFLITGNSLDFTLNEFGTARILSPESYWNQFGADLSKIL